MGILCDGEYIGFTSSIKPIPTTHTINTSMFASQCGGTFAGSHTFQVRARDAVGNWTESGPTATKDS
jgi:hypothetical protein